MDSKSFKNHRKLFNVKYLSIFLSPILFSYLSCGKNEVSALAEKGKVAHKDLQAFCDYVEPEFDLSSIEQSLCTRLETQETLSKTESHDRDTICRKGQFKERIGLLSRFIKNEYLSMGSSDLNSELSDSCLRNSIDFAIENMTVDLEKSTASSHSIIPNPTERISACWAMRRVREDGCVIAAPCHGNENPDFNSLPIRKNELEFAMNQLKESSDNEILLCRKDMQTIHKIKDSGNAMSEHNYSFFNLLTYGRYSPHITYGAANCHGTALHLSGAPLNRWPMDIVTYHSPQTKNKCESIVEQRIARTHSEGLAITLDNLDIDSGGVVINMNHSTTTPTDKDDCGDISLQIFECEVGGEKTKVDGYLFANKMSLSCYDNILTGQGFRHQKSNDAASLYSGCVLTQNDHSIKILMASNDMCYYYESASPFAAPQLRVSSCLSLQSKFKNSWCPQDREYFKVTASN